MRTIGAVSLASLRSGNDVVAGRAFDVPPSALVRGHTWDRAERRNLKLDMERRQQTGWPGRSAARSASLYADRAAALLESPARLARNKCRPVEQFLGSNLFRFLFFPLGSAAFGIYVKVVTRNDRYRAFTKEDMAVGLDLMYTAF